MSGLKMKNKYYTDAYINKLIQAIQRVIAVDIWEDNNGTEHVKLEDLIEALGDAYEMQED